MATYKSKYYEEKEKKYKSELHTLQKQLPRYMMPYLTDLELRCQVRTCIGYTRDLITFFEYLQEENPTYGNLALREIPYDALENLNYMDINEFQRYLSSTEGAHKHSRGDHAIQRALCALSGFFKYEVIHEHLAKDPTLGASRKKKLHNKPIDRLDVEETNELLNGVEASLSGSEHSRAFTVKTQLRDTAIITVLLGTGIRVSECAGLDLADVNFRNQTIRIVRKGGDIDDVYFNSTVAEALHDYIDNERPAYTDADDEPALFLSNRKKRMAVRSIQEMVAKYGKSTINKMALHPHTFRKTFGTSLYDATGDIAIVADVLGHKSIETTRKHYAAISEKHKAMVKEIDLYKE